MTRLKQFIVLAGAAPLLFACAAARAQADAPESREQPVPAQGAGAQPTRPDEDPARLRERLAGMLERLESGAAKVRSAIARLDEGASVDEAIEELGGPMMVRRFADAWERWNAPRADDRRGPPGEDRGGPPPEPPRRTSREEVMGFLEEHAPGLAERLRAVQEENPRGVDSHLERLTPRVAEILAAREHDPELGEILTREFQVWMKLLDAAGDYGRARRAGEEERAEEARSALRELAAEQVDLRLRRRQHEVDVLAQRLESLRADIEKQKQDREAMIDQLVERTTAEGWRGGESGDERRRRRGNRD